MRLIQRASRPSATSRRPASTASPSSARYARLALLDESARAVVVAGAVVGDFEPLVMRALTDADDAQIAAGLSAGVRAGLIETTGGSIAFRHAIIRDAVLDATVPHLVDTMHRRAAAALSSETVVDALERRAHHLS